jgi:NAD(P)-dependent dehydrogenase (short-subunit alcohol dehydrogenase family)
MNPTQEDPVSAVQATTRFDLEGKVAIVTGGAAGIGAATVETLARLGAAVVIADIDLAGATALAEAVEGDGGRATAVQTDVSVAEQSKAMVDVAVETYGRLDVLHNNAAAINLARRDLGVMEIDEELWEGTMRVNGLGVLLGCQHAIPAMIASGGGSIINTSSVSGLAGASTVSAYAASKAAVIQLTKDVAAQFGKQGIRCNSVAPGLTLSEDTRRATPADIVAIWERQCSTPYVGEPQDIANVVAFLASDASRYVTGVVIPADGGLLARNSVTADVQDLG